MNEFLSVKNEISIDGGLSVNPYFCRFLANVLNRRVKVRSSTELTALGTARLAAGTPGDTILNKNSAKRYEPEQDMSPYQTKFTDAVNRSVQWRSR
jgi:glycerol kinase